MTSPIGAASSGSLLEYAAPNGAWMFFGEPWFYKDAGSNGPWYGTRPFADKIRRPRLRSVRPNPT